MVYNKENWILNICVLHKKRSIQKVIWKSWEKMTKICLLFLLCAVSTTSSANITHSHRSRNQGEKNKELDLEKNNTVLHVGTKYSWRLIEKTMKLHRNECQLAKIRENRKINTNSNSRINYLGSSAYLV